MRKIDAQLLSAIQYGTSFAKGNRSVTHTDDGVEVRFHGHHIATIAAGRSNVSINNCGYWTNTTKQILNEILRDVLGYGLFQRQFDWFVSTPQGDVEYLGNWQQFA